jgi:hypothetical protein
LHNQKRTPLDLVAFEPIGVITSLPLGGGSVKSDFSEHSRLSRHSNLMMWPFAPSFSQRVRALESPIHTNLSDFFRHMPQGITPLRQTFQASSSRTQADSRLTELPVQVIVTPKNRAILSAITSPSNKLCLFPPMESMFAQTANLPDSEMEMNHLVKFWNLRAAIDLHGHLLGQCGDDLLSFLHCA